MGYKVLVIEDEPLLRDELAQILTEAGYDTQTANDGSSALVKARNWLPDLVVCDLRLPGLNGIEIIQEMSRSLPRTKCILVTAYGTLDTAIQALRHGVVDFILKPLDIDGLLQRIEQLRDRNRMAEDLQSLRRELARIEPQTLLSGSSHAIAEIRAVFERLAGTRTTVLIQGETGTGKELVAREIHNRPPTYGKPMISINCGAIPESLFESELFGARRGSYTGADQNKVGLIERASGGTLFLDEIGEMPLSMQAKLLRVIETKQVRPVGALDSKAIDIRFIAASNRHLSSMVADGTFREDLFYRLRVVEIKLPPLRDRRGDIPSLAEALLTTINNDIGSSVLGIDNQAMQAIVNYNWPGNVRELRNALEHALLFHTEGYLKFDSLPEHIRDATASLSCADMPLKEAMRHLERNHIEMVLNQVGGNREEAARILGINRSTLFRKLSD